MMPFTVAPSVPSRVPPQSAAEIFRPKVYYRVLEVFLSFLTIVALTTVNLPDIATAAEPSKTEAAMEDRVKAVIPEIEAYTASGMKGFDVPGLALGIVVGDKLVYARGFGVRSKAGGAPVDTRTIFQIGSNAKAFLTTTMAIMVDRGKLRWDDRVVDLEPEFQLKDPWVTREFRVFDLAAQRSSLPAFVNDMLAMYNFDEAALIRSLRHVEPVTSFRTTFAYTNITHLLASHIVAKAAGAPDWNAVLQKELLDPLGMKDSTYTVEAIEAAANHANGHRWTPEGTVEVPFTRIFPFFFFQAEDGIRDLTVTGVQTCALPICRGRADQPGQHRRLRQGCASGACRADSRYPHADRCELRLAAEAPRRARAAGSGGGEIGRASCRGRGEISVVAVSLKKKRNRVEG